MCALSWLYLLAALVAQWGVFRSESKYRQWTESRKHTLGAVASNSKQLWAIAWECMLEIVGTATGHSQKLCRSFQSSACLLLIRFSGGVTECSWCRAWDDVFYAIPLDSDNRLLVRYCFCGRFMSWRVLMPIGLYLTLKKSAKITLQILWVHISDGQ